jgi:hypothetical protein
MARLPQPGGDAGNWGAILNEYLSESLDATGKIKPGAISKSDVGLSNVDNTSDVAKPVSTAVQTQLEQHGPLLGVARAASSGPVAAADRAGGAMTQ